MAKGEQIAPYVYRVRGGLEIVGLLALIVVPGLLRAYLVQRRALERLIARELARGDAAARRARG